MKYLGTKSETDSLATQEQLALRVRVDAAQDLTATQQARGRANLGTTTYGDLLMTADGSTKATPVAADSLFLVDSAASNVVKRALPAAIKTWLGWVFSGNAASGYLIRPDGTKRCWGQGSPSSGTLTVTFPFTFTTVLSRGLDPLSGSTDSGLMFSLWSSARSTSSMTLQIRYFNGSSIGYASETISWWVEGV